MLRQCSFIRSLEESLHGLDFSMHLDPYLFSLSSHGRIRTVNLYNVTYVDSFYSSLLLSPPPPCDLLSTNWAYATHPCLPRSKMFKLLNEKQVGARQQA